MDSDPTKKIYPATTDCNRHPGFQRSAPPAPTEGASLTTCEFDQLSQAKALVELAHHDQAAVGSHAGSLEINPQRGVKES
jgi:hypothetical protein